MKRKKNRCRNCGRHFIPDRYNHQHHYYCNDPACRKASRKASDKKYRRKMRKDMEFVQNERVRVKRWQAENPEYKKNRKKSEKKISKTEVLRDFALIQKVQNEISVLRDFAILQGTVLKGFISYTTGEVLRDDVTLFLNRLYDRGKEVSGTESEADILSKIINIKERNETQGNYRSSKETKHPGTFHLG